MIHLALVKGDDSYVRTTFDHRNMISGTLRSALSLAICTPSTRTHFNVS
jgi:hypothetical protein